MSAGFSFSLSSQRQQGARQTKVSDLVFQNIWQAIVEQELAPGQNVTEEFLAQQFDVSRTPLREAVQRLIGLGMIVRHPNRTMSVAELDLQHIMNLSQTRESLEGLIAVNVMDRVQAGEVNLGDIEQLHLKMQKLLVLEEPQLQLELGRQFHEHLEALSNNTVAISLLDQVMLAMEPYRRLILGKEKRFESIVAEHGEIINNIKAGNKLALLGALNEHFANARESYRQSLKNSF